jgi:hypothetical protein
MAMKTHPWFRNTVRSSTACRRSVCPHIKPRRLIMERIEDRLMLSVDYQTGIELQLGNIDNGSVNFVIIPASTSQNGIISFNNAGEVSGTTGRLFDGGISVDVSTCYPKGGADLLDVNNGGPHLISIVSIDFPPAKPDDGLVDLGLLSKFRPPTDKTMFPQDRKESTFADIKQPLSPTFKSISPQMGVDGVRGRSQVFDLTMTNGLDRKSDAAQLPDKLADVSSMDSKLNADRLPTGLPGADSGEAKSIEVRVASKSSETPERESNQKALPSPDNLDNAAQLVIVAEQDRPMTTPPLAIVKADSAGSSWLTSQSQQSEPALAAEKVAPAVPITKPTDHADAGRQAVFAEMGKNHEKSAARPTFIEENRTNALGLAIVAVAGQFLGQKWWHQTAACKTHQLPPRRRSLAS